MDSNPRCYMHLCDAVFALHCKVILLHCPISHCQILHCPLDSVNITLSNIALSNITLSNIALSNITLHCDIAAILDVHLLPPRPELHLILLQQDKSPPAHHLHNTITFHHFNHIFPSLSYLYHSDGKEGGYNNMYIHFV